MFSINDEVYYGRTWEDLKSFLVRLDYYNSNKKIVFIHNLSFEFQYLKSIFKFKNVVARKKHKVMKCEMEDFNIEIHCTYMMSNCALKLLPKIFMLPVEKKVGDLDYTLLRTPATTLTEKELGYSNGNQTSFAKIICKFNFSPNRYILCAQALYHWQISRNSRT